MKVFMTYEGLMVPFTQYDDPLMLDLVAHFLGIALHQNDNACPTALSDTNDLGRVVGLGTFRP